MNNKAVSITDNINKVLVGKPEAVKFAVMTFLAGGHLLLEDVPGVGKTTLANALAVSSGCDFSRIQFTPDTLPGDVTGTSVYDMKSGNFRFIKGAVMSNIVLADEINRTSPKTQASLLEAMEEKQVTADGKTYHLEDPFMVIATQNPSDFLGTYNLPEAQLDRFMMRISIGYPGFDDEKKMAENFLAGVTREVLMPVVTREDIIEMRCQTAAVKIVPDVSSYIVSIVSATRENEKLRLGASPRATLAMIRASQACAYISGRDYVTPDDVQNVVYSVLCHRVALSSQAKMEKADVHSVIERIVHKIGVPVV
ncbi:MAG: MoxR family ATPase [Oscillospiraceae bacterium]|nr:MoxR family ATPase [Oscillospiraceae bacterium]